MSDETHLVEGPIIWCDENTNEGATYRSLRFWMPRGDHHWKQKFSQVAASAGAAAYGEYVAHHMSGRPTGYYANDKKTVLSVGSEDSVYRADYSRGLDGESVHVLFLGCKDYATFRDHDRDHADAVLAAVAEVNDFANGKKVKHWFKAPKRRLRLKKVGQHKKQVIFVIDQQSHGKSFNRLSAANGVTLDPHDAEATLDTNSGILYVPRDQSDEQILKCPKSFFDALKDACHEWETGEKSAMAPHWTDEAVAPLEKGGVTVPPGVRYGMRSHDTLRAWFESLTQNCTGGKFFRGLTIPNMRTLLHFEPKVEKSTKVTVKLTATKKPESIKEAV